MSPQAEADVIDPYGVSADAEMPLLAEALDPRRAERRLARRLTTLTGDRSTLCVQAVRVIRYKPQRRCVLEYDLERERPDGTTELLTVIGKARAGRPGRADQRLQDALWRCGFDNRSPDFVSVPEPLGVVEKLGMWFQRKVAGTTATERVASPDGAALARRVAEAAHKLHHAGVPTERSHSMADELRILEERLALVAGQRRDLAERVERVLEACRRLGASTREPTACGIHRDFYPDQVLFDGERLHVIDFDLYCIGDPALDIGNFAGHLMEQSLRTTGDPDALRAVGDELLARFLTLAGEPMREAVRTYTALTLARHLWLSNLFAGRRPYTGALLELCEERLSVAPRVAA